MATVFEGLEAPVRVSGKVYKFPVSLTKSNLRQPGKPANLIAN